MVMRSFFVAIATVAFASAATAQTFGSTGRNSPVNAGTGTVTTSIDDATRAQGRISADALLTEAEQATLKKCLKMAPAQQAQSSKCSAVMVKAGKNDPAKDRGPGPSH
jgi:hypothetical protein